MNTFFDENGILNLDEAVFESTSFKTIVEDGIVTDAELLEQSKLVTDLFHQVEKACTPEQSELVKELIAELSVLFTVYHYKEIQSLK